LPRTAGHKVGVDATKKIIQACVDRNIKALTLFAFSSENWKRPKKEVGMLMDLFFSALRREINEIHAKNARIHFIGDISAFSDKLKNEISQAEQLTQNNTGLRLSIAANYGGRWDIAQAMQAISKQVEAGEVRPDEIDADIISRNVMLSDLPEPDLFIRTGGEQRISNFLLWQLAYTELYFTEKLWPDFNEAALDEAISDYSHRQRRFGRTGEQVETKKNA
jgi:undecaprenyl diphosphate synthase